MKWVLIIVLICVIMLIAHGVSEQIKERFDFYSNLKNFLNEFKLNLSFKQEKIAEFLNDRKTKKQFNIFIEEYKKYLKNNEINLSDLKILSDEEKLELEDIIKNIGSMDVKNELSQLENYILKIDSKLKQAEQDKLKLCPMILKLSLLFAIGIAIILI